VSKEAWIDALAAIAVGLMLAALAAAGF